MGKLLFAPSTRRRQPRNFGVRRHVAAFKSPNVSAYWKLPVAISADFRNYSRMNWPHGPVHWLFEPGIYIVTAGTYRKLPHLNSPARLDFFQKALFQYADEFGWDLRAWAVLANHYHFVAASPTDPRILRKFLGKLHMKTAEQLNLWDNEPGRKVWFQFWDSHITFERSYLARLNYVHQNPVRHGLVPVAENYKWCSAFWFAENAPPAFVNAVKSFKMDQVNVPDDF
jgi:putative transposase